MKQASAISFDVLHIINHGPFSAVLCDEKFLEGKKLWVSFHDYFSIAGSKFDDVQRLWNLSERRLVISDELGRAYQQLFGNRQYEVITDGVADSEVSAPVTAAPEVLYTVYFAGLLHMEYLPLFRILADAADALSQEGYQFKFILRGTQQIDFLENRAFGVEYRTDFVTDAAVKDELDSAFILYLPIKFNVPEFYLYSLSTKMIGYLGASGSILFHGPPDSAASTLLQAEKVAVCCHSLDTREMIAAIRQLLLQYSAISVNAKKLAKRDFQLSGIQERFWQLQLTEKSNVILS